MKALLRVVLILVFIAAVASGYRYWKDQNAPHDASQIVLFGNIDVRQVELAFNNSERIEKVLVEEGDSIQKGQLIGQLELERFQLVVAREEALVESQKQVVARLEAGSRLEEIEKAKADVAAAEANAIDQNQTLQRVQKLVEKKVETQQDLEDAQAAVASAKARVQALKATLDLIIAGPRKEDIAEAKAMLKRYEAELAQAKHDLSDAHLYAPSDGIVQERILEVGDMASPQKTVYTVALTNPIWVRAYVTEPDLGKLHEGMQATITTDSFPGKKYEGWIGFISPVAEFTPKPVETTELRTKLVYQVRVFAKNPNKELRLGMPATVSIDLSQAKPDGHKEETADAATRSTTSKKDDPRSADNEQ